jgi:hypothetical protein
VLKDIKTHLESKTENNEAFIKILIPLQQIDKKHWTLLAIDLSVLTANNETATHDDSKGLISRSYIRDISAPASMDRIKKWVQNSFPNIKEVDCQYCNAQGLWDSHNCGRYTLIKLYSLLNPKAQGLFLEAINKLLNGEAQTIMLKQQ